MSVKWMIQAKDNCDKTDNSQQVSTKRAENDSICVLYSLAMNDGKKSVDDKILHSCGQLFADQEPVKLTEKQAATCPRAEYASLPYISETFLSRFARI